MNFGDLFAKTLSSVQAEREDATRKLEHAANENLAVYLVCLGRELGNEQQQVHIRTAAGLAIKNALSSREYTTRVEKQQAWLMLPVDARNEVKACLLNTLGSSELRAALAGAQAISAVAAAELPNNQWTDLINGLLQNVASQNSTTILKQATLQAIGFICEEIPPEVLESQANSILTAVVQGARKEEPSMAVKLAAITALTNSLEFIKGNFENQVERDFIMQVVCEATTCEQDEVVVAAFQCLVKIMSLYYDKMGYYMQQALYMLTIQGMKNKNEHIQLQAIEFWSTVCDVEVDLAEELKECQLDGIQPERRSQFFAKAALSEITPVLLWLLTKQDEDADEDEWNASMAAGTCLSLLALCVEDEIVPHVVPFVEQHIRNQDWRYREASVMAFGSILEGPSSEVLQPLVSQAIGVIIEMMQDSVVLVKDTAAWTLGRMCELHSTCIQSDQVLEALISSLLRGLTESPRVAANCAWAFTNLADQMGCEDPDNVPTGKLSRMYEHISSGLVAAADRRDGNESSLRTSAYEALATLVEKSAHDCLPFVEKTALIVVERIENSVRMESQLLSTEDRVQHAELQTALCGVIQSICRRVGKNILPLADRIMAAFFSIFQSQTKTPVVVEDVFLAIGVLINSLENEFARYLDHFVTFLFAALQNHEEHQLCSIAVGIVGDLSRALGEAILPHCDNFMAYLLQNLQSAVLHRDVKPPIITCFGDIALAIQSKFNPYLPHAMSVLQQASTVTADERDYEMHDYVNYLRESILEAYTGIVQGFKADNQANLLLPYIEPMFAFLMLIQKDNERTEPVLRSAVGLIGDLASTFGSDMKNYLVFDWIESLLKEGRSGRISPSTKEVAKWAKAAVKAAVS